MAGPELSENGWERWRGRLDQLVTDIHDKLDNFIEWSKNHEFVQQQWESDIERRLIDVERVCKACREERKQGQITRRQLFLGLLIPTLLSLFSAIYAAFRILLTKGGVFTTFHDGY